MLVAPPPLQGVFLASAPVATGYFALYAWLVLSRSENPIEKPSPYNFEAHAGTWHDTALLDIVRVEDYRSGRLGAAFFVHGNVLNNDGL